jgi:Ca-activated chloride channel family protein
MSSGKGGGPKDAFALLMSAGRKQQQASPKIKQQQQQQQQQQQRNSNSAASTQQQQASKRQRTQSLPTQLASQVASDPTFGSSSEQQQPQPDQEQLLVLHPNPQQQEQSLASQLDTRADSSLAEPAVQHQKDNPAPDGSPSGPIPAAAAAVDKQAAVAAFKRAFSGGLSSSKAPAAQKFDYLLV